MIVEDKLDRLFRDHYGKLWKKDTSFKKFWRLRERMGLSFKISI
ncbi:hypothetical protein [Aureliella helgolandensis]|nr:hypothetical protein [Aureliella helgolandensis]